MKTDDHYDCIFYKMAASLEEQRKVTLEILMELKKLPEWRRDIVRRLDEVETRLRKLESAR